MPHMVVPYRLCTKDANGGGSRPPIGSRTSHDNSHGWGTPVISELHRSLVETARRQGWQTGSWKDALARRLRLQPWAEYDSAFVSAVRHVRVIPDAFRFRVDQADRNHDWLLWIDLLEVEVTHRVSAAKLALYRELWFDVDCSARLELEVFQMDRFGIIRPLMNMELGIV